MKNDTNIALSLDDLTALLSKGREGAELGQSTDEGERDTAKLFFKGLISALLKYWWVIVGATLIFAVAAFAIVSSQTPEYTATVQMYARNRAASTEETELNLQEIANADYYIKLYGEYLKLDMPLENLLDKLNTKHGGKYADLTAEELYDMIGFGSRNGTPIFYVSVTDTDQQRAVDIAGVIAEVLPMELKELTGINEPPVKVIDWPEKAADAEQVSRQRVLKTVIAAFVGFLLACVFAYVKGSLLDDTIDSSAWLSENFKELPLLAEIPDISSLSKSGSSDADKKE